MPLHHLVTPRRFLHYSRLFFPFLLVSWTLLFVLGLYTALISSPPDYQQGESVRIMYIHVPSAWMSLGIYCMIACMNAAGFIWKNPFSFIIARAAAPIGACFCLICLITGSLWGKPIWGTWWVWDARLTSMLILFFFYLGYIMLYDSYHQKEKGEKMAGLLSLVGIVNIPIIKFSVNWWHTLHQPASLLRKGGIAIAPEMLTPLLLMFGNFILLFVLIWILRVKTEILERKLQRTQMAQLK